MREVIFDEEDKTEYITHRGDTYKITFPKGLEEKVWLQIEKNNQVIFLSPLIISRDAAAPIRLPFKVIVGGDKTKKIDLSNLRKEYIVVLIDD